MDKDRQTQPRQQHTACAQCGLGMDPENTGVWDVRNQLAFCSGQCERMFRQGVSGVA